MGFCIHCGARFEDLATRFCTRCGASRDAVPQTAVGRRQVRVGSAAVPVWLLCLMAVLTAGGITALLVLRPPSEQFQQAGAVSSLNVPPTTPSQRTYTVPAPLPYTYPPSPTEVSTPPPAPPPPPDPAAILQQYYQDINDHNYAAAWALGGSNISVTAYDSWVAGYATTAGVQLGAVQDSGSDQVTAVIQATQTDGSVKFYNATYTVANGVIVKAHVTQA